MHDVMLLSNRFIEISKEFSGMSYFTDQPLHQFITNSLILPSLEVYKVDQLETLKNLLLVEDWTRLPLPDRFKIQELVQPLHPFSSNINQLLGAFNLSNED